MYRRLRTTSFAGFGAILLVLIVSGMVAAASILTAVAAPEPDPVGPAVVDTTGSFEDANGDGIDDDCQTDVVADETAAAAGQAAVDLNHDGTISVSEAAQSDRTGGTNCNHGGYVSQVAHDSCGDAGDAAATNADSGEPADTETNADEASTGGSDESDGTETENAEAPESDCAPPVSAPAAAPTTDQAPTCDAAPTNENTPPDPADTPKNHGAVVSQVAQSDAVGGKNCNHGGAVSEASHKDNEARKAARDAAREAAKAARDAAKAAKHAGKSHGHGH